MILLPSETDLTAYRPSAAVAGPLPTFADAFYITIIQRPVHVIGVPSTTFATCDDDYENTEGDMCPMCSGGDWNTWNAPVPGPFKFAKLSKKQQAAKRKIEEGLGGDSGRSGSGSGSGRLLTTADKLGMSLDSLTKKGGRR